MDGDSPFIALPRGITATVRTAAGQREPVAAATVAIGPTAWMLLAARGWLAAPAGSSVVGAPADTGVTLPARSPATTAAHDEATSPDLSRRCPIERETRAWGTPDAR